MLTTAEKIKVIMKRNNFTMTELANQLNCSRQNLSNIGVGLARGGSYGIYWAQEFATFK